jgi:hypothetical protein
MAKKSANFIDLHAEKVVLGVCALALVAAGVYTFGGLRFKVNGRGPAEIVEEAGRQADRTAQAVKTARPPANVKDPNTPGNSAEEIVKRWFAMGPQALIDRGQLQPRPWRTQKFPPVRPEIAGVAPEDRRELVKAVAPSVPIVVSDRKALDIPQELPPIDPFPKSDAPASGAKSVTRSYVSVGAEVDLSEVERCFRAAKYPPKSRLSVVAVHLQRRDESEPWRGWQNVETFLPFKPLVRPEDEKGIKLDSLPDFKRLVDACKRVITRTELPSRSVTYPPLPSMEDPLKDPNSLKPEEMANRRVKKFVEVAKKAMAGKKPFMQVDLDAAYMNARAAAVESGAGEKDLEGAKKLLEEIEAKLPKSRLADWKASPQPIDRLMPLMAHDLDIIPGHSYAYRIRYEVLNPSAGVPGDMRNAKDAEVLTVFSDWSPPSRPVEVTSDLVFFLTQADPKKKDVTVTVYRKTRTGDWRDQEYKIKAGETIGQKEKIGKNKNVDFSTGLVCVDIDFARLDPAPGGKKTVAMVYVDPSDGKLREKYLSRDLKDKDKVVKQLADRPTAMK